MAGRALLAGLLMLPLLMLAPVPAPAQSVVTNGDDLLRARFLPGRALEDGARMAGLLLEIAPGWKTYWRNPGAVGIPPRFDWSASENLASAEVFWPRPEVIMSFGLETLGYEKQVVLPVRLVPVDPARPIDLRLTLEAGVCQEICVFATKKAALRIEPGAPEDATAALVAAAEAAVPPDARSLGLSEAICRISGSGRKRRFEAEIDAGRPVSRPKVAIEGPETAWFENIITESTADGQVRLAADLSLLDETVWIERSELRLTLLADGFAADFRGCTGGTG